MLSLLRLVTVYAATVMLVAMFWERFGRPIPRRLIAVFSLLPLLVLAPAFLPGRTILPVHDIANFQPWASDLRFQTANPYLNDAITQMAPWQEAVRRSYRQGALPFWNRLTGRWPRSRRSRS